LIGSNADRTPDPKISDESGFPLQRPSVLTLWQNHRKGEIPRHF
jgi:hypothetical protein